MEAICIKCGNKFMKTDSDKCSVCDLEDAKREGLPAV